MNQPFHSKKYDLAHDTISREDIDALIEWLKSYPRLTMGELTKEFERVWSKWLGVKYSVFCNSGSSANLLMYAAMQSSGRAGHRRIIVPSVGWATTIAPAMQLGWDTFQCMCEADPVTYGLDLEHLKILLDTKNPGTVILVHVLGTPNNMTAIMELQRQEGFELLEDCCAAHGARHQGRLVGTFGAMSSFSFYYGHHISTIEGGMVSTNDEELYHHLLMARSHGWIKDLPVAEQDRVRAEQGVDPFHAPFTFMVPGFNLRATDLQAFIGLRQMERIDDVIAKRVVNHREYQEQLRGCFGFAEGVPGDTISSISFGALARDGEHRKRVVQVLVEHQIDTRLFSAGNLGRHPFWIDHNGEEHFGTADRIHDCGFFLPNNQSLTVGDIVHICDVVKGVS